LPSSNACDDAGGFTSFAIIPLPAALPLMGAGLALLGFLGWRKKRKASLQTA
jgi:hypothetical protein